MKHFALLLFVLASSGFVWAQRPANVRFMRFPPRLGLDNKAITCTVRDASGLLWIGSETGLYRFDGYRLRLYDMQSDSCPLKSNFITALCVDRDQVLWIGTKTAGLYAFDLKTEHWTAFENQPDGAQNMPHPRVYSVYEDRSGHIWVGTGGGAYRLDRQIWPQQTLFLHFAEDASRPDALSHNRVTAFAQTTDHQLFIGTKKGLNLWDDRKPDQIVTFLHDGENPTSLHDDEIYCLLADSRGDLWIGTWGEGVSRLPLAQQSQSNPKFLHQYTGDPEGSGIPIDVVFSILEDRKGNFWFADPNGALAFLPVDQVGQDLPKYLFFDSEPNDPFGLPVGSPTHFFQDQQDLIWLSGGSAGLVYVDPVQQQIETYYQRPADPNSFPLQVGSAFAIDPRGRLWAGDNVGLTHSSDGELSHWETVDLVPHGFEHTAVSDLLFDSDNRLWLGTIGHGLAVTEINKEPLHFTHFEAQRGASDYLANNTILTLAEDDSGVVWVGTYSGLYRAPSQPFEANPTFGVFRKDVLKLPNETIEALAFDGQGSLWIGTQQGLARLNLTNETSTSWETDPGNPNALPDGSIWALLVQGPDQIWVGTATGLYLLQPSLNRFSPAAPSLTAPSIKSLTRDPAGQIWVGTNNGLYRLNPEDRSVTRFTTEDGFLDDLYVREVGAIDAQGRMYIGSGSGFSRFDPLTFKRDTRPPQLALRDFFLFNKRIVPGSDVLSEVLPRTPQIDLYPGQSIFSIEMAAADFRAPNLTQYRYQMAGFHPDWIETDANNRRATFTKMQPGHYTFHAQAINAIGTPSPVQSVLIVIHPPWYKTWWAQILFYGSAILILVAIPLIRLRLLRKRSIWLEREVQIRTEDLALANQQLRELDSFKQSMMSMIVHDLKNPLSAILHSDLLLSPAAALKNARHAARQMLNLVLNILDLQKFETTELKLRKERVGLNDVVREALAEVEHLARTRNQNLIHEQAKDYLLEGRPGNSGPGPGQFSDQRD